MTSPLFAQAQALHQRSQYLEAEQAYRQVLAAEPGNAPAWHWLAILYYQQQRGGDALTAVEAALKIAPDAPDALMLKGALLQAAGRAYEARDAIANAVSLKPGNGEGWYNLGLIESELKNLDAAVAAFDRTLALAPGAWPAVFARGGFDGFANAQGFAHVELCALRLQASLCQSPDGAFKTGYIDIRQNDMRTFFSEGLRHCKAKATRGAGNECYSVCEVEYSAHGFNFQFSNLRIVERGASVDCAAIPILCE